MSAYKFIRTGNGMQSKKHHLIDVNKKSGDNKIVRSWKLCEL